MLNYSFFDKIQQAVCLVNWVIPEGGENPVFSFEFNSSFTKSFPSLSPDELSSAFGNDFYLYLQEATSSENSANFQLSYQGRIFDILNTSLTDQRMALLFQEKSIQKPANQLETAHSNDFNFYNKLHVDKATFDDAPLMVLITDAEAKIVYANKKFVEVTGYSREELLGENPRLLKSGNQCDLFYQQMWNKLTGGQIWNDSFHNKKKNGQLYWQRNQIIPLIGNDGEIKRYISFGEDITDDKATETILLEKSDLLAQLIENTPDVICVKDGKGRWLLANRAYLKLFGMESVHYYGKSDKEILELAKFHKEDMKACMASEAEAWNSKSISRKDERIELSDDSEIILDALRIPSFNKDNSPKLMVSLGRDITLRKKTFEELKRMQKRFALAQKASGIASWEWDLDKLTINWAENLEEVFGSSTLFENKNFRGVLDHVYPEDRYIFLRKVLSAIKNREEYDFEIRIYDVNGQVKWIKLSGNIHYDNLKDKWHLLGIVYDISERKEYVDEIIKAKLKAEESDRLKSTFLATMSHELRTPLNAVIGFSDIILGMSHLESEIHNFVSLINNNGQQLLSLIEDIFDLSLIESKQVKIYKSSFDLVASLQELSEIMPIELKKMGKAKDVEFLNELPNNQIIVHSDANRITQIISNLLKNAIKFTPHGYIKLGLIEDGKDITVFVEDTGIGISKEKQKIVFEIFRQVEESLTRKFGGAGLGLSLSHNLAELLGAKLWLESEEGKGSKFLFKIERELTEYKTEKKKLTKRNSMNWKDKYVLIAEDEYSNFELLHYMLKPTQVRIKQVTNGNDAIDEVLNKECPDLILMDIKMPDLNGFEATKSIKEVYPDIPIIAQTAFAISGDREMALAMGCDEYISKPIKKLELLELMEKYLG
jgi:PAS domain S-box-containing protein